MRSKNILSSSIMRPCMRALIHSRAGKSSSVAAAGGGEGRELFTSATA
uniref:Uncharacterized protein n=1 Tax=Arundo donax TaxID=35708 RepID=A0A0A9EWD8_ARUDO